MWAQTGVGGQCHALPALRRERESGSLVQEAGWAPRPFWMGAANLKPPPRFNPQTTQPVVCCYTDCCLSSTSAV
jgi:hypothetical protein